ncbi:hypothetical protein [Halostagnicola sp. A56]|uniref:hypothetical protein n=1 Tax=Halostagnicola sp. A56 TaxID=1495067 RepID=UPI0004A15D52|nr:hypothetical protein [Halostagnicola sp. A56]
MTKLNTQTSVLAQTNDAEDYDEGEALAELEPGQGVVRGAGGYEAAGADSKTKRVVREQRNPGSRGIEDNQSPLEKTYPTGSNVETTGFQSHDEARLLVAYADVDGDGTDDTYDEGADLGWNANGYLEVVSGGDPSEAVAQISQEDSVTMSSGGDPIHVRVEFY